MRSDVGADVAPAGRFRTPERGRSRDPDPSPGRPGEVRGARCADSHPKGVDSGKLGLGNRNRRKWSAGNGARSTAPRATLRPRSLSPRAR